MDVQPPLPAFLRVLLCLALLCLALPAPLAAQEDWPQFRGADGRAVAGTRLPTSLDPGSPELRWKAEVPGHGNSSPVVSKGQVFVTTAYEGRELSRVRTYTGIGMCLLGVIALLSILGRLSGKAAGNTSSSGSSGSSGSGPVRFLGLADRFLVVLATLGFATITTVAILDPSRLWAPGIPGDTWLVTGTAGLIGLFAAFGWLRPASAGRALAAAVLLGVALSLYQGLPLNKHHAVYRLGLRLALVAPGVLGAIWHLLLFVIFRRQGGTAGGTAGTGAALALTGMALLLFVQCNLVNPTAGLVRAIVSLDLATGKRLWNTPLFVAPEERLHRKNTFATPTPCVARDGERILAFFGPGWACVDRDGNKLWEGRDEHYMDQSHYGAVSSPIRFEDTFILLHDTERTDKQCSYVMALDAQTGRERWRIDPDYAHESYMTPLLMPVGGPPQLITVTFGRVVAYDPRSGDKTWELELPTWQHVPSLTYLGDLLFVAGGAHQKWVTAAVRVPGGSNSAGSKPGPEPEVVWQTRRMVPSSASPVCHGGLLFTVTTGGILVCYDPETGRRHWKKRLDGSYLASLVAGDGKVYACSEEGDVVVIAAQPEFRELSRTNLGEAILATPAIAQGHILIRTKKHVYCFCMSQ